jgi:hypothetical protein
MENGFVAPARLDSELNSLGLPGAAPLGRR